MRNTGIEKPYNDIPKLQPKSEEEFHTIFYINQKKYQY